MNQNITMFGVSLILLTLIVAVVLGFMAGPTILLTWLLLAALIAIPLVYRQIAAKDFIAWNNAYSVGIDSIDQQHKKLINLINQLQTAVKYSTGEEFEREALDALVDYTRTHFKYEEGLMQQNAYPDYEAHRAQHETMISKVEQVLAEYEREPDTAMSDAADFLRDWLLNHINGTDKAYSRFLIDKGVQ